MCEGQRSFLKEGRTANLSEERTMCKEKRLRCAERSPTICRSSANVSVSTLIRLTEKVTERQFMRCLAFVAICRLIASLFRLIHGLNCLINTLELQLILSSAN